MPRNPYWTKTIQVPADESTKIIYQFKISHGGATDFSLALHVKIDGRWHLIKRCDATPRDGGAPHCHIYKLKGKGHRISVGAAGDNLGIIVSEIIEDIRHRLTAIVDNYLYSR